MTHSALPDKPFFNISYPIGGFGQHLRWLLLLDDRFRLRFDQTEFAVYQSHKKPSWPSFQEWCQHTVTDIAPNTKQEIQASIENGDLIPSLFLTDAERKLNFLFESVYPNNRTWHNWLLFEWTWKKRLDCYVPTSHQVFPSASRRPTIYMISDPELCYRCFMKLESNLNRMSPEQFKQQVSDCNHAFQTAFRPEQDIMIDSGDLFVGELPHQIYHSVCEWAGLDPDHYHKAQQIHTQWYFLHRKAEQEFVADITAFYKNDK